MLPTRPPVLNFDGLDPDQGYRRAQAEFARLFLTTPIIDVLGRRVVFEAEDCEHICFKEKGARRNPYNRIPRDDWRPDRAALMPWILAALTAPETRIRPSPVRQDEHRQSYVVIIPADSKAGLPQEFFGVFVRPGLRAGELRFITAFTLDQAKLDEVKKGGPQLYPAKAKKGRK